MSLSSFPARPDPLLFLSLGFIVVSLIANFFLSLVDAQATFVEIVPSVIWSPRIRANDELITTGRNVTYTDYANEIIKTIVFDATTSFFYLSLWRNRFRISK